MITGLDHKGMNLSIFLSAELYFLAQWEKWMILHSAPSALLGQSVSNAADTMRDCTLFIGGVGLEIFTERYFKKSLSCQESTTKCLCLVYNSSKKVCVPLFNYTME